MCIFKRTAQAAAYAGIALKTLDTHLQKAYARMEAGGVDFKGRSTRSVAITAWTLYWWSEEGKANLRNVQLTADPLA